MVCCGAGVEVGCGVEAAIAVGALAGGSGVVTAVASAEAVGVEVASDPYGSPLSHATPMAATKTTRAKLKQMYRFAPVIPYTFRVHYKRASN